MSPPDDGFTACWCNESETIRLGEWRSSAACTAYQSAHGVGTVELVTVMGVLSLAEICKYLLYHEPPMLLIITELSITMLPVSLLLTKKMALPKAFTWFYSMREPHKLSVMVSPSL
jgi:hypothetical protein